MALFTIETEQKIPASIEEVWDFISSPANLRRITPDYMGFEILTKNLPDTMYPGMIIAYKVSPLLGIKMTWVTEITQVKEYEYFIDEQLVGPYSLWHHQHRIFPIEGGVLMNDIINYRPPLGILGRMANGLIIRRQLQEIFDYRRKKLIEIFGEFR